MKLSYILLTVLALLLSACSPIVRVHENERRPALAEQADAVYTPVTIENINEKGDPVAALYERAPQRVVAVWQNSIETLLALGVGDRIIAGMGVPDAKYIRPEYRAAYEAIPYTSLENLDVETILMMQPDLIVGWSSTFSPKVLRSTEFWAGRGVHTYIAPSSARKTKHKTIAQECEDIRNLGRIFARTERAEEIVGEMMREIAFVREHTAHLEKRPRALVIEFLGKEIRSYGEDTLAGDMLRALGADHLAADGQSLSMEELVDLDPDALFIVVVESAYGSEDAILARIYENPALRGLSCVKERRIHTIPLYAVYSAGIRTYDGITIFARGLYPEIYNEKEGAVSKSEL
ncbi:MAG: ABC transporter substrate-binding protein [Selenomonas noxia]|jgi:putative iron compound ABC transporter, periplasmic iron compound-binding protein